MVSPIGRAFCAPIRRLLPIREREIRTMQRTLFANNWRKLIGAIGVICGLFPGALYGASCESVRAVNLSNTTITLAVLVAPGGFTTQGGRGAEAFKTLPAFCRVAATLKPSSDSDIKIEVW